MQPFLQARFRVFVDLAGRHGREPLLEPRQDHRTAGLDATVEINGTDHRFERIGEDRITLPATGFHLARPKNEALAEIKPTGDFGKIRLPHENRACAGQRTLVGFRPALVQGFGHQQGNDSVTEELKALVVRRTNAAVA